MAIDASKRFKEVWTKAFLGDMEFSNYEVSNLGRVKSGKKLLIGSLVEGYARVNIYQGTTKQKVLVHRLIMDSWSPIFESEPPNGFPTEDWELISREAKKFIGGVLLINHKDHNKVNNNILNLERVTSKQNSQKAIEFYDGNFKNGRGNGRKFNAKKLTQREKQVLELMCQRLQNQKISELLKIGLGTTKWHIHNILKKIGTSDRKQAVTWAKSFI